MAHPTVMKQVIPGLHQAGLFQYKTTLKVHPTVIETIVIWA